MPLGSPTTCGVIGSGVCSSAEGSESIGVSGQQFAFSMANIGSLAQTQSQRQQQLVALGVPFSCARGEGEQVAVGDVGLGVSVGVSLGVGQAVDYLSVPLMSAQSLLLSSPTAACATTGDQQPLQPPPPSYSAVAAALEAYRCS